MTHVVWFCCPGLPSEGLRAAYDKALAPLGDVSIIWIARAGLSSVFRSLGREYRKAGRIVPQLLRDYPPSGKPTTVSLVAFSAGYGLIAEALINGNDRSDIDAVVLLDAIHAGFDVDGSASDQLLEPFVEYAKLAKAGAARFWIGYTDVQTPQPGQPGAFASTEQATDELVRLAGGLGGDFWVRRYDLYSSAEQKREHGAALTEWGPGFAAEALVPFLRRITPKQVPWHDGLDLPSLTVGERCLAWLGYQYGLAPREIPGPVHDDTILSYSRHCRRGGRLLGVGAGQAPLWAGGAPLSLPSDESPWCAALQSEALRCTLLPGETPPHGLRVSVRELVEDARAAGTLRGRDYVPRPGDLAIEARGDGDPLKGGTGHVRCVIEVKGDQYNGLGGNEDNRIAHGWQPLWSPSSRAWIVR